MKIIICLNHDVHAATALNFLFPHLQKHEVRIVLSQKVGKVDGLAEELGELRKVEQEEFREMLNKIDEAEFVGRWTPQQVRGDNGGWRGDNLGDWGENAGWLTFKQIAKFFQTEISSYENINSEIALEDFRKFAPDLIVSIRFGQIFRSAVINVPKHGVINLHSGILPNYRGVMPSFWAILNGDSKIGTTLHYISDATIDTGATLGFSYLDVDKNRSLFFNINRLYEGGCVLIIEHLRKLSEGEEIKILQEKNLGEGQYFSYPKSLEVQKFLKIMPLLEKDDGRLDVGKI